MLNRRVPHITSATAKAPTSLTRCSLVMSSYRSSTQAHEGDDRVETTTLPSHMLFAAAVSSSHASGRTQPLSVS